MSRRVFLALLFPGVVVGVYWISAAWMSDSYDSARWAKAVTAAFYAMVLVGLWVLAVVIGAALVRWLRQ
jgi:hypothetical protein